MLPTKDSPAPSRAHARSRSCSGPASPPPSRHSSALARVAGPIRHRSPKSRCWMIVSHHSRSSLRARTCSRAKVVNSLVYVDRLTGWLCFAATGRSITSHDVVKQLRSWFLDVDLSSRRGSLRIPVTAGRSSTSCRHPTNPRAMDMQKLQLRRWRLWSQKQRKTATWTSGRFNEAFSSGAIPGSRVVAVRRRSCSVSL